MMYSVRIATGLLLCMWGVWFAASAGVSRLYSAHGLFARSVDSASRAVKIEPADPEAYYARAVVLFRRGELTGSAENLERSADLRPSDYFLWQELGSVRDLSGDHQGALTAFRRAVLLAPTYVQPRWHLGNLLIRMDQAEAGFSELRQAAAIDRSLLPALIDLAFGIYQGESKAIEQAVHPQTSNAALMLACQFVRYGNIEAALEIYRRNVNAAEEDRRGLLLDLLRARHFTEGYEVWQSFHKVNGSANGIGSINDGDFESNMVFNDQGFGWQIAGDVQQVRVAVDTNQFSSGRQSLQFGFNGNYEASQPLASQLVLVQSRAPYRLKFSVRTESLVTGGLPLVVVMDADDVERRVIAESEAFPEETTGWRNFSIDFSTSDHATAVLIQIRRRNCTRPPCPIFGHLWLDNLSLEKL